MAVYESADEFYQVMREVLKRLEADPEAVKEFAGTKMAVRIRGTAPAVELVIDGRHNPVQASVGPSAGKADLELTLSTDLLHDILVGKAGIKDSFMSGQVKVSGNIFRAMRLAGPFRHVQQIYPQVLQERNEPA
jgi:putative sterol carrier protein